jgi:TPP-dependent 2-oxoacid decarboxylase
MRVGLELFVAFGLATLQVEVAKTLLAVYRHAESHPAFRGYYFGEAAHPSVTAWFNIGSDEAATWSIYTGVNVRA